LGRIRGRKWRKRISVAYQAPCWWDGGGGRGDRRIDQTFILGSEHSLPHMPSGKKSYTYVLNSTRLIVHFFNESYLPKKVYNLLRMFLLVVES
jgi:hypothetical protein